MGHAIGLDCQNKPFSSVLTYCVCACLQRAKDTLQEFQGFKQRFSH